MAAVTLLRSEDLGKIAKVSLWKKPGENIRTKNVAISAVSPMLSEIEEHFVVIFPNRGEMATFTPFTKK
ncbi:hypothetical protein J1TS5_30230 [Paenibacillus macerans]|uniref:hypothetical protein n=1 Tax=Paenibacillus macerans TaxID=44252 RepID=UPI001B089652|nr:hypothetical protein [Paenibacillus macerans]GIP10853.1 hypothetical protein J1TS5_30230 [Paenibacillus macerans]